MGHHFERPTTTPAEFPMVRRVVYLALVTSLGIVAGAAGFMIAQSQYPSPYYVVPEGSAVIDRVIDVSSGNLTDTVAGADRQTVMLVRSRARGSDAYAQVVDPVDILGPGIVVTSDGWIMTSVTAAAASGASVSIQGNSYPVQKIATDQFTGINFIKIDAQNLYPVRFAEGLQAGEMLLSVGAEDGLVPRISVTRVLDPQYEPVLQKIDYIHTTDLVAQFVLLDAATAPAVGQGYFQDGGSFAGFVTQRAGEPVLIRASLLKLAFEHALGGVPSSDLGIYYMLEQRYEAPSVQKKGIIVYHPTRVPVRTDSLAAKAGLQKNDVILRINGETIDENQTFEYLWKKYQSDPDGVELTVDRNGSLGTVQVTW